MTANDTAVSPLARSNATRYLPEIQGLRTVALLLVAIFHIWVGRVSGGVDVFLLISAYLLTRSLTVASIRGHEPQPAKFIVRKFARLLPLAATAIVTTLIAAWMFMPPSTHPTLQGDALASLGYVENLRLQHLQTDYYAHDLGGASLYQHFWSLSVQGQVFLLWPLLHLLGHRLSSRTGVSPRRMLARIFGGLFVASFLWSLWHTFTNQPHAYFDTAARMWEFAAGSLLALIAPRIQLTAVWRALLSWVGLLGIVLCGLVLPVESSFPGVAALWPVVSAAFVIVAAEARPADLAPTRLGADRLLATGPLRWAGKYTYALYLFHWPVLLIAVQLAGGTSPGPLFGLLVLAISAALSWAATELVEFPSTRFSSGKPVRRNAPTRDWTPARLWPRHLIVIVTAAAVVLVPIVVADRVQIDRTAAAQAELDARFGHATHSPATAAPTAEAAPTETQPTGYEGPAFEPADITFGAEAPRNPPNPNPIPADPAVAQTFAGEGTDCTEHIAGPGNDETCWETNVDDPAAPTALFLGNSHTQQYAAIGYETKAITNNLNVRLHAGPGCRFGWTPDADPEPGCERVWAAGSEYIAAEKPELVVVLGSMTLPGGGEELPELLPKWLQQMHKASPDTTFVVLRDNPRFADSPYDCALAAGFASETCNRPANDPVDKSFIAKVRETGALWVDLTPYLCPDGICRPEIGGVVTWFDDNHVSTAFVRTLAQRFTDKIRDDVPWWPEQVFRPRD